ncbi:MAG TPA: ABC transporter permease [Terracidiphilus sp.]|jgi:predicted permease
MSVSRFSQAEGLQQDLRYTLRVLARSPGFTVVALLTLALGIGANTAMFSVVEGVVLAPLPFLQPDRLVFLWESRPGVSQLDVSYPNFQDWQRSSRSFEQMSALTIHSFDMTGAGAAEHLTGIRATSALLATLGVTPAIGREFSATEDQPHAPPVVLISDRLWRERMGADPHAPGRSIMLDGKSYTVIGVLLRRFHFMADADVITPLRPDMPAILEDRSVDGLAVVARLKPGVSVVQAQNELWAVQQGLDRLYPDANRTVGVTIASLKQQIIGDVKGTVLLLFGAVGLVLMIACANLANLFLARSTTRMREFGVRSALGASRGRMVRQLITESLVLSLAGGGLGLGVAEVGLRLFLRAVPDTLPRAENVGLNLPVLLFTLFASMAVGVMFGIGPALRCARVDVQVALQQAQRGATSGRHRLLSQLVVLQFALTVVLLVGAGLLLRSIRLLWHVNPGFDTQHVISFQVGLAPSLTRTPQGTRVAYQQLLQHLRAIPGVAAADLTNIVPLTGADNGGPFWIGGTQTSSLQEAPRALYFWTGPDYLKAMQIPLLQGRFFNPGDTVNTEKVVAIDTVLAQAFFPGQNPVGQSLTVGHWGTARIVGVVGHVRHWGLDDPGTYNPHQIYIPAYQLPDSMVAGFFRNLTLVVRSPIPLPMLAPALRDAVRATGPDQPLYNVRTMEDVESESMASRRLPILLLGSFAALALLLASVGIYGVVSYSVMQRVREIGIRVALGAARRRVFRMIVGRGMRMAAAGLAIGAAAALALTRVLPSFSHLLYGVGKSDPLTFFAVCAGLMLVAVAACYVPARRAMRTDPMISLRCE